VVILAETLVRFEAAQEIIIDKLTELGIFKTKSEVIRAGILGLGREYDVFKSIKDIEDEMVARKMKKISRETKQGKRKTLTFDEVLKKQGFKKSDLR